MIGHRWAGLEESTSQWDRPTTPLPFPGVETGTELRSGRLRASGLADLLRSLASENGSGVLRIGNPPTTWIVFGSGQLICAGAASGSRFADAIRAQGAVTESVLEEQIRRCGGRDLPLLDALARTVNAEVLRPVVRQRLVETVFDLYLGGDDLYQFAPGAPHELSSWFTEPVEEVLAEVTERLRRWAEIAQSIPSTDVVFRLVRHLPKEIEVAQIGVAEWSVLAAVDGRRSVAQVISAVGASAQTVCAGLHELHRRGLLERTR